MKLVIIESPLKGCYALHEAYLNALIRDCIRRGETPYSSHRMLTAALSDLDLEERELGIVTGLAFRDGVLLAVPDSKVIFGVDFGYSEGMARSKKGLNERFVEERMIPAERDVEWGRIVREAGQRDAIFHEAYLEVIDVSTRNSWRSVATEARALALSKISTLDMALR